MPGFLRRRPFCAFAGACALLAGWLILHSSVGNPLEAQDRLNTELGLWSTRFLIAALAVTPLSEWRREPSLRRWRRPLGLAAVGFAALHTVQYVVYFTAGSNPPLLILQQPYQVVGLCALTLLLPLALTSNSASVRRIGPRRWKALHRLVYPAAILAAMHALLGEGDMGKEPGLQALAIAFLLAIRFLASRSGGTGKAHRRRSQSPAPERPIVESLGPREAPLAIAGSAQAGQVAAE